MKFSIALIGFFATQILCAPDGSNQAPAKQHRALMGIASPLHNRTERPEKIESTPNNNNNAKPVHLLPPGVSGKHGCRVGGRGHGYDHDYGCDQGWCWTNCAGPFILPPERTKPWCWLAYKGGTGDWVPCKRWSNCEYAHLLENAKCSRGNGKPGGCGC